MPAENDEKHENQIEDSQEDVVEEPDESTDEGEHLVLHVGHGIRQRRLDRYLHGRFGQFSRNMIKRMIKDQGVTVNGKIAKPSQKLNPKDIIDLVVPVREKREIEPEPIPLNIIYEDDEIIIVNKQANLIVHPARGNPSGTLANALVYHSNELSSAGGSFRPGIVHRLDRNTTGVMVVAKNDTAHWKLARQFERRQTCKYYLAVVQGVPELDADCIDQPLGVHPSIREKYAIRPENGKNAVTFYERLEKFRGFCVVKLSPKTGRTHQLRVHMSYLKHPIVGDDMYGGKPVFEWQLRDAEPAAEEAIISRCALHAWILEFKHPLTEQVMSFKAPIPEDMHNLIKQLRKYRSFN